MTGARAKTPVDSHPMTGSPAKAILLLVLVWAAASHAPLAAQAPRRQEPQPPFPYSETDVAYASLADGTPLTGTLTVPQGEGPFPAALLISGAGPQDRNYDALGHRPFLVLADHLARRGIAVLRVDDRGTGGSGGDAAQASVADVLGDLGAGVELLRSDSRIDAGAVGLIAHSEGGRVAPIAAGEIEGLAFLVLLAPPAVGARDLAEAQAEAAMEVSNDPLIAVQTALIAMIREAVGEDPDPDAAMATILDGWDNWLETLPTDEARTLGALRAQEPFLAQVEQLVAALGAPWNRELYRLDPAPPLRSLDVPVLALYGDRDRQAPAGRNIPVLETAWLDHPDATIQVLPGLNHFFQHAQTGLPAEIPQIEETLAPEALEIVSSWIGERFAS